MCVAIIGVIAAYPLYTGNVDNDFCNRPIVAVLGFVSKVVVIAVVGKSCCCGIVTCISKLVVSVAYSDKCGKSYKLYLLSLTVVDK